VKADRGFQEMYEAHFPKVFRAAYALGGDRGVAEDAAQEAFARALERWGRLRDLPWAPGWVMVTALNVARRALRRRREDRPPSEGAGDVDESVDLWQAVRALPDRQRRAVVLHYVGDLSVADVAAAMRCGEGTVKTHLARAREALRPRMEVRDD
jgi:RNA polymerase sigma-70 factor (ECF subfamily)